MKDMNGTTDTILYRGSLKSCNYSCSYCPFSKHRDSEKELERDEIQWQRFIESLPGRARAWGIRALMVVPYGEALLHPWYWEGLAKISRWDWMDAAGAQTNLSFSVEEALGIFREKGGDTGKLRLWATFHPEMVSVEIFAQKCAAVKEEGILLSVGAVGVPEDLDVIRRLKDALPEGIPLWINKMDGLKRPYTREERERILELDPYFELESAYPPGEAARCQGRLFVEADGNVRACSLSPSYGIDWYTWEGALPVLDCRRRRCSCYLAYGGRQDPLLPLLYGAHPLFRIPCRPKAAFLDIEGTLRVGGRIPAHTRAGLAALFRKGTALFFATTLPYGEVLKRCGQIVHLFTGGIFAGGAHLRLRGAAGLREEFIYLADEVQSWYDRAADPFLSGGAFRILVYRNEGRIYKITLLRSHRRPWEEGEAAEVWASVPEVCRESLRYFLEGACMQIVSAQADKARGAVLLCEWMGIGLSEAAAAGDQEEDRGMLGLFAHAPDQKKGENG